MKISIILFILSILNINSSWFDGLPDIQHINNYHEPLIFHTKKYDTLHILGNDNSFGNNILNQKPKIKYTHTSLGHDIEFEEMLEIFLNNI